MNSLVVYFNIKTHNTCEGNVITRREISIESIRSRGSRETREATTLRRLILWRLECMCVYGEVYCL